MVLFERQRNVFHNYLGLQSQFRGKTGLLFTRGRHVAFHWIIKHISWFIIGMSFAFRKNLFNSIQFSTYFEGYGLYEDADFIRVLQFGKMYQYQSSKLNIHVHRKTNQYQYGKMVVRNGWYVWRTKIHTLSSKTRMAFHNNSLDIDSIAITFTSRNKAEALRNCG
jgi:hypothetical protein